MAKTIRIMLFALISISLILLAIPVTHVGIMGLTFSFLFPPGFLIMAAALGIVGLNFFALIRFNLFLIKEDFQSKKWDYIGFSLSIPIFLLVYFFVYDKGNPDFYINRYSYYVSLLNMLLSTSLLFFSLLIPKFWQEKLSKKNIQVKESQTLS